MKTIVTVNCELPSVEHNVRYSSKESLHDYDIILFNPELPYYDRISFSAGGSCISIEGTEELLASIEHWKCEITDALEAGKSVFFLLNDLENESCATGSTSPRKGERNYITTTVSNYNVLPIEISIRNAKGRKLKASHSWFQDLRKSIESIAQYKVIIKSKLTTKTFQTTTGDHILGGVVRFKDFSGRIVLLPYFTFYENSNFDNGNDEWSDLALGLSKRIAGQLIALDKNFKSNSNSTPTPEWVEKIPAPANVNETEQQISNLMLKIKTHESAIDELQQQKSKALEIKGLLYENGEPLENAITKAMMLLDYDVQNFRENDLEIDHIIISPSGMRMIGEAEGKDTSPINISKFRQLESNILEDLDRDEIESPAQGIIFGNGFRLKDKSDRDEQFTDKCLKNAQRLNTILIRTADLYDVAVYVLNNPKDSNFKESCRNAIESALGKIVEFPLAPS